MDGFYQFFGKWPMSRNIAFICTDLPAHVIYTIIRTYMHIYFRCFSTAMALLIGGGRSGRRPLSVHEDAAPRQVWGVHEVQGGSEGFEMGAEWCDEVTAVFQPTKI